MFSTKCDVKVAIVLDLTCSNNSMRVNVNEYF